MFSHINNRRNELVFFRVNNREGMNGNSYLIAFTMNSYAIVVIVILLCWSELHINFFLRSRWNHSLLPVFDLEELGHGRENMESLGSRREIYEPNFDGMSLHQLETCELNYWRRRSEDAVLPDHFEVV